MERVPPEILSAVHAASFLFSTPEYDARRAECDAAIAGVPDAELPDAARYKTAAAHDLIAAWRAEPTTRGKYAAAQSIIIARAFAMELLKRDGLAFEESLLPFPIGDGGNMLAR